MASNKHAQVRYKVLDDCFSNFHRKYYFQDLLDRCNEALKDLYGDKHLGIKARTLRNDINYVRTLASESGVEVKATDDGNGFYYRYSDSVFSIFNRGLGEDDLAQLKETILMLQRFRGMPNFDWMSELVVKLEDKLNLRESSHSVVGFDENKTYTGLDWFQDLFDAIINKLVLHIQYKTFSDITYDWTIHPYYIKEYNNRWFLFGLNEEQHTIYNVPLDRIWDIEQIHKEYIPSDIDFESYLDDVVGVSVSPAEKENIRLQFSSHRFPYVLTKALHQSQRIVDFDNRIIEISVIPNNELEALILSFGRDVEVISPASYREQIQSVIRESYEKYYPVQVDCTAAQ
ncbi:MAG: WYL domain-containing protein [Bacteroidales bacterium]|jgi:predicted DNA-binding transcriptional regulator YafY|nr:WYL domain-containing protein [Bacteroidales bacterium]